MGLFDTVRFSPPLKCSEGHELGDFQTKDTDVTYTRWTVTNGRLSHDSEPRPPFSGSMSLCAYCRRCPSFVAKKTGNIVQQLIYFEAEFSGNVLLSIERTSIDFKEWVKSESKEDYLKGALGPMTLEEALATRRR